MPVLIRLQLYLYRYRHRIRTRIRIRRGRIMTTNRTTTRRGYRPRTYHQTPPLHRPRPGRHPPTSPPGLLTTPPRLPQPVPLPIACEPDPAPRPRRIMRCGTILGPFSRDPLSETAAPPPPPPATIHSTCSRVPPPRTHRPRGVLVRCRTAERRPPRDPRMALTELRSRPPPQHQQQGKIGMSEEQRLDCDRKSIPAGRPSRGISKRACGIFRSEGRSAKARTAP